VNWYNKHIASKSGTRILYHIGKGYPQPVPYGRDDWRRGGWERYWAKYSPEEKVVFLTPDFVRVHNNHGIDGNLYIFEVPEWVIKEAGGIHVYDYAPEVIIPEHLWKHVIFKGKKDEGEVERICKEKVRNIPYDDYYNTKKKEGHTIQIGDYVVQPISIDKNNVFEVLSIKENKARLKYVGRFKYNEIRGLLYFIPSSFNVEHTAILSHLAKITEKQQKAIAEARA